MMHTPWGKSQDQEKITRGINFYSTAGHGGYKVSAKLNEQIPDFMRNEDGWYEEDCEWCIPAIIFHEYFKQDVIDIAVATFRNWFPDAYEQFYQVELQPGESHERDRQQFAIDNYNNFVGTSAFGDWHDTVPSGMVGVYFKRESDGMQIGKLIPQQEYASRMDQRVPRFVLREGKEYTSWHGANNEL